MTTITFINQKGGVGKTTTTMLTAESLAGGKFAYATHETRVLLIDLDPLGSLSDIMLERYEVEAPYTVSDWLNGSAPTMGAWTRLGHSSMYLLPANNGLEESLNEMSANPGKVFDLRNMIQQYCTGFDLVLIDAPPSLSALAWAAIIAADLVVVPTLLDRTSIKGTQNVLRQIADLRDQIGMAPAMVGTIANMYDSRVDKHRAALELLTAKGMPKMLGTLPVRQGRRAWRQLKTEYSPIADTLMDALQPILVPA